MSTKMQSRIEPAGCRLPTNDTTDKIFPASVAEHAIDNYTPAGVAISIEMVVTYSTEVKPQQVER